MQILPNVFIRLDDPVVIYDYIITVKMSVKYNVETYQVYMNKGGEYEQLMSEHLSKEKAFIVVANMLLKLRQEYLEDMYKIEHPEIIIK